MKKLTKKPITTRTRVNPSMAHPMAHQAIATLCSLCLCLWGYQTGAWRLAIPMALVLEARHLLKRRWQFSGEYLSSLHALCGFLWLMAVFLIPADSPTPIPYHIGHHLLKCLPVGIFPLILAQTYCGNFTALYGDVLKKFRWPSQTINFYYPYFGICVLAASATGGSWLLFLMIITVLIAGFLSTLRPQRFTLGIFYGLIYLAFFLSLIGIISSQQFQQLQVGVPLNPGELISQVFQNLTSSSPDKKDEIDLDSFKPAHPPQASETPTPTPNDPMVRPPRRGRTSADRPISVFPDGNSGASPDNSPPATPNQPNTNPERGAPAQGDSPATGSPEDRTGDRTVATASPEGTPNGGQNPNPTQSSNPSDNTSSPPSGPPATTGTPAAPVGSGSGTGVPGPGGIPQAGGRIDPATSQTRIGQQGSIQPANTVLMRVSPNREQQKLTVPLYLKAASFNQYDAGAWNAVNPQFVTKPPASQKRWTFGSPTPGTIAVRISTQLQPNDVLKLPVGTSEIDQLAVDALQVNQYGTVAVQGKPGAIAYTAKFDPSQSRDAPPTQLELAIPPAERPTLEKILTSLDVQRKSAPETVQAIEAFFRKDFRYSLELPQSRTNTTPIADFLLRHRSGHCEYYATATSLLLRAAGIPSRYVVGYSVHEYDSDQQAYLVRASDAHAWVMAYVNRAWVTLDTTPGNGQLASRSAKPDPTASPAENGRANGRSTPTPNQTPAEQPQPNPQAQNNKSWVETLRTTWSSLDRRKQQEALLWIGAMLGVVLVLLLTCLILVWRLLRRRQQRRSGTGGSGSKLRSGRLTADGLDSTFYLLEKQLGQWGLERQPAETGKKWMVRLQQQLSDVQAQQLQEIMDLHYRHRFDPEGISEQDCLQLESMIRAWLKDTRATLSRRHQKLATGTSGKGQTAGE